MDDPSQSEPFASQPAAPVDPEPVFSALPSPPPAPPPGGPTYYPAPPPSGGFWSKARNVMLTLMLVGSVLFNAILIGVVLSVVVGGMGGGGDEITITERVYRQGDDQNRIALIDVAGMIEPRSTPTTLTMLVRARNDSRVGALLLRIDSPGGTITDSDEIHRLVKQISDAGTPVVVSMGALAASGGYYIAAPADSIIAQPTTLTGSIGVIAHVPVVQRALSEKLGVDMITMTNQDSPMKDAGSIFDAWDERDKTFLQGLLDDAYEQFVGVVIAGRSGKLTEQEVRALADGRAYTATEAHQNGLVDKIGYLDAAIVECERLAGATTEMQVRRYRRQVLFGGLLGARSPAPRFDGNLRITFPQLDELHAPRLLYLWQLGS